jgi:hypothetical protein
MKQLSILLAGITLLALGNPAHGVTITWTNTSGGYWSTNSNWSPNQVPTNTDNVLITKPGTYTVTFDLSSYIRTNIANLTLGAGGGAAGVQTLVMPSDALNVGSLWLVTDGGVVMANDSSFAAMSAMIIANGGVLNSVASTVQNLLIVTNGGVVNSTNGTFEVVTVANNGIVNSRMDSLGGGAFTVANGGILNALKLEIGFAGPPASLTVASGGVMNMLDGSAVLALVSILNGVLTNYGTINITNTGFLIGYGTGAGGIINEPGGTINLYEAVFIESSVGFGVTDATYFINRGNVTEISGTNSSTLEVGNFDNTQGTITNLSGTLVLETLSSLEGVYSAETGATIQLVGGGNVLTPDSSVVVAGNGQIQLVAGTLLLTANSIPKLTLLGTTLELGPDFQGGAITNLVLDGIALYNTLPVTGTFIVTNSQIAGNFTVGSGGVLSEENAYVDGAVTVANGAIFNLNGGTDFGPLTVSPGGIINMTGNIILNDALTNSGTVNFNDSLVGLYTGIINQPGGLLDFSGEANTLADGQYFINHGKVVQNSPSGTNIIALVSVDNSQGTFTNLSGTSVLETFQTNLTGIYYASPGASIQFNATSSVTNPFTTGTPLVLAGGGQYQLTSSYIFLPTSVPANLTLFGTVLELGPAFQGGAITNLTFGAMTLTNTLPVKGMFTATNQSMLYGNFTVANGGVFNDGATVNGAVIVANGGLMTVVGFGLFNANSSLALANGATLNISDAGLDFDGPLTNAGTINITNPPGGGNSGIYIYNSGSADYRGGVINQASGLINLGSDNADIVGYFDGFEYLINQGRITKSAGTNYSDVMVTFTTNSGAITAQSGEIVLFPFVTQTGGSLNAVLNNATNYLAFVIDYFPVNPNVSSNIVLGGAFNATLANGYVPTSGTAFNVLWIYSGSYSGTFGSLGLPAVTAWQSSYGNTNFTIVAGAGSPKFATFNLSGTNLLFHGMGGTAGSNYVVLVSTNLALPLTSWTPLTTNKFDVNGQFRYTNHINLAKPRQFFIFKLP